MGWGFSGAPADRPSTPHTSSRALEALPRRGGGAAQLPKTRLCGAWGLSRPSRGPSQVAGRKQRPFVGPPRRSVFELAAPPLPWPAGGCHLARLPTPGGGHEGVRRGGSARVYAQGAKEARGEERSAYPAWGGFHLCAVPEHPGRPSAVRPLLTTTSPPPSRGGAADPRLSAGGASRNLWLCFSKVAFTYSATCSPASSDRRMRPGNPSRCRAVPTPECPLVPPPGPCPPPGSPCSDFSLPVLQGDITDPYGIHYTRPALLTDPVFVHLPTC